MDSPHGDAQGPLHGRDKASLGWVCANPRRELQPLWPPQPRPPPWVPAPAQYGKTQKRSSSYQEDPTQRPRPGNGSPVWLRAKSIWVP